MHVGARRPEATADVTAELAAEPTADERTPGDEAQLALTGATALAG